MAEARPRDAQLEAYQFVCSTPLCAVAAEQSSSRGPKDPLLGAALPLLLGMLALVGAMGIRPRA